MSELEVSTPTPEDKLAELMELRAERATGAQLLEAARARADQDAAALREASADRDRWRSAAESIQGELQRQIDELRVESSQQRDHVTQLAVALTSVLEAIAGTTPTAETESTRSASVPAAVEQGEQPPAPAAATSVAPAPETPAPPGEKPAPPVVLAPYVPANEPPRPHLEPEPEAAEFVPDPDQDRVGMLAELMAVAVDSAPPAVVDSAEHGMAGEPVLSASTAMDILPTVEPVSAKRRRLPRLG